VALNVARWRAYCERRGIDPVLDWFSAEGRSYQERTARRLGRAHAEVEAKEITEWIATQFERQPTQ
jgi:hypothetical protein